MSNLIWYNFFFFIEEEEDFFFGLATAPAHVEDRLNDAWLQFAAGDDGPRTPLKKKKPLKIAMEAKIRGLVKYIEDDEPTPGEEEPHNVAAWHNVPNP